MVSIRRLLWLLAVLALLLVFGAGAAIGRSHNFANLDIDAWVQEDGSLRVEEHRVVSFSGRFTGMYQWINTGPGVDITDIEVREGSTVYRRLDQLSPGPAGTFFVREEPEQVYIDWSYVAVDETRRFTLSYTMTGAVKVHDDVAELYIQYVGDEWDQQTQRVLVRQHLPAGASAEDIRAWGHGPLHGEVNIVDGETVEFQVRPLPANTMLEGRITFPPELVPAAPDDIRTGRAGLPGILEEEEAWAREANMRRWLARLQWVAAALLPAIALFLAIMAWVKWGRDFKPQFDGDYFRELPGDYSPAEMSVLYSGRTVSANDLTATILDLARRGFIAIEEVERETKGLLRTKTTTDYMIKRTEQPLDGLAEHEAELLDFLFKRVDKGRGEVGFSDLERFAKNNKRTFASFWKQWQEKAKLEAEKHDFFDHSVEPMKTRYVIGGMLAFGLGVGGIFLEWIVLGAALIVSGVILFIGGLSIGRRSRQGAEDMARWKSFRRFLLHFSNMDKNEIPSLILWEHFLVYAVSLGIAKEVIKQLQIVFPNLEQDGYRFGRGWYYGAALGTRGMDQSISNLTSTMSSTVSQSIRTATSQSSSGSGGGGGFSGGGGGGAGGGGGGVR